MSWTFHTMRPGELARFCDGAPDPERLRERLAQYLDAGSVRPQWCWFAADGDGRVLARHYWWGTPGSAAPIVFSGVSAEDEQAACALLAHARDEAGVTQAWSEATAAIGSGEHPSVANAPLVRVLTGAGFGFTVGRVRVEWTREAPIPAAFGALAMRPARELDEESLLALFEAVADGSADHGMISDRNRSGPAAEARERLDFVRSFRGEPDLFAVGVTPAGELAGYVVPAYSGGTALIAELGVAAAHRGRRYARDLLAHGTAVLAAAGAPVIRADTDLANTHMRAAFARAGYREYAWRDDYGWRRDERAARPAIDQPCALESARLRLTPLAPGDAAEMTAVLADRRLYDFTGGAPLTPDDLHRRYQRQSAGRPADGSQWWHNWIIRPGGGEAAGYVQATITGGGTQAEVAWVTGAAWQGRGYASEAAAAVTGWLADGGVAEIRAHIHPGNRPSQIVASRCGLSPTDVAQDGEVRWRREAPRPL